MNRAFFFLIAALLRHHSVHPTRADLDDRRSRSAVSKPSPAAAGGPPRRFHGQSRARVDFGGNLDRAHVPSATGGNRGMLFLFNEPRLPAFWMKNMLIPLDLVFLDETGTVVDVVADVQPCAAEPCPRLPAVDPALAVLEMGRQRGGAGLEDGIAGSGSTGVGFPVSLEE